MSDYEELRAVTHSGATLTIAIRKAKAWRTKEQAFYEVSCERCGKRTEGCDCLPGLPMDRDDPWWDNVYGDSGRKGVMPDI